MQHYSVVTHKNYRETGRSAGMPFEQALAKVRQINRANQDHSHSAENAYVETTASVKHLPVTIK